MSTLLLILLGALGAAAYLALVVMGCRAIHEICEQRRARR